MRKGATTREAIVEEALVQATRLGFEGLSLAPLAESLELSKSGLFAHFKSKEALQLAVLEEAIARFRRQVIEPALAAPAEARLTIVFERYLDWIAGKDNGPGCLFVTLAQEYDERPGPIRDLLVASQRDWREGLGRIYAHANPGKSLTRTDLEQFAFEFIGLALSFQHASKLLGDARARSKARSGFTRLLAGMSR
jgi:AcrR family transcriptional regulator